MARSRSRRKAGPADVLGPVLTIALFLVWLRHPTLPFLFGLLGGAFGLALVASVWLAVRRAERLRRAGIADIDRMDGAVFEHKVGQVFTDLGYRVRVTRQSGDFGADVVAERDGERVVIQAKRYGPRHPVGVHAVQEAVAAIAYYKANRAIVVTNRRFTTPAGRLAAANRVELWDRRRLVDVLARQLGAAPSRGQ